MTFPAVNFGHMVQVPKPHGANWLCFATGENPHLLHAAVFLPFGALLDAPPAPAAGGGGGDAVPQLTKDVEDLQRIETGGAIVSMQLSEAADLLVVNVRRFQEEGASSGEGAAQQFTSPAAGGAHDWAHNGVLAAMAAQNGTDTAATFAPPPPISANVEMQVWNVKRREMLYTLDGHKGFTSQTCPYLLSTSISKAGFVASGSEDKRVYVWSMRHRRLLRALQGHEDVVTAVAWHPTRSNVLVSASDDNSVRVWR